MSTQQASAADTGRLLRAAIDIADSCADLAERRHALLGALIEITESEAGHWCWVRARQESDYVLPVSYIHRGYSEEKLVLVQHFMVDPVIQSELFGRLDKHRQANQREDGVWSIIFSEGAPDIMDNPNHPAKQKMDEAGYEDWMQGGKFVTGVSFSVMSLLRKSGSPRFERRNRELIDLAFTHIPWLWANPDETVSQETVDKLTPRQRAVTFLLLDGHSRKQIGARLGIGDETVDTHLKAVFKIFGVQSGMELAAIFLRKQ